MNVCTQPAHENNPFTLGGETPPLLLLYEKPFRVYTPSLLHSLFQARRDLTTIIVTAITHPSSSPQ